MGERYDPRGLALPLVVGLGFFTPIVLHAWWSLSFFTLATLLTVFCCGGAIAAFALLKDGAVRDPNPGELPAEWARNMGRNFIAHLRFNNLMIAASFSLLIRTAFFLFGDRFGLIQSLPALYAFAFACFYLSFEEKTRGTAAIGWPATKTLPRFSFSPKYYSTRVRYREALTWDAQQSSALLPLLVKALEGKQSVLIKLKPVNRLYDRELGARGGFALIICLLGWLVAGLFYNPSFRLPRLAQWAATADEQALQNQARGATHSGQDQLLLAQGGGDGSGSSGGPSPFQQGEVNGSREGESTNKGSEGSSSSRNDSNRDEDENQQGDQGGDSGENESKQGDSATSRNMNEGAPDLGEEGREEGNTQDGRRPGEEQQGSEGEQKQSETRAQEQGEQRGQEQQAAQEHQGGERDDGENEGRQRGASEQNESEGEQSTDPQSAASGEDDPPQDNAPRGEMAAPANPDQEGEGSGSMKQAPKLGSRSQIPVPPGGDQTMIDLDLPERNVDANQGRSGEITESGRRYSRAFGYSRESGERRGQNEDENQRQEIPNWILQLIQSQQRKERP